MIIRRAQLHQTPQELKRDLFLALAAFEQTSVEEQGDAVVELERKEDGVSHFEPDVLRAEVVDETVDVRFDFSDDARLFVLGLSDVARLGDRGHVFAP